MVSKQQHTLKKQPPIFASKHPAYLWIGSMEQLNTKAIGELQDFFCPTQGCKKCITCRQIVNKQFHGAIWLKPEKKYKLQDLNSIFETMAFGLEDNQHCFFILQYADYLGTSCGNKLLKSLEEPPEGYHFILLAQQKEALLPTIISRCVAQYIHEKTNPIAQHPLYSFFTEQQKDPISLQAALFASKITEVESMQLVNQLLQFWVSKLKKSKSEKTITLCNHALACLRHALEYPPMPGSAKVFWKNLFLNFYK